MKAPISKNYTSMISYLASCTFLFGTDLVHTRNIRNVKKKLVSTVFSSEPCMVSRVAAKLTPGFLERNTESRFDYRGEFWQIP
jgi:hypothetical protein